MIKNAFQALFQTIETLCSSKYSFDILDNKYKSISAFFSTFSFSLNHNLDNNVSIQSFVSFCTFLSLSSFFLLSYSAKISCDRPFGETVFEFGVFDLEVTSSLNFKSKSHK